MPAEFEKLVKAIKAQLKKDNPNSKDEDLASKAYAIATTQWKKAGKGNPMKKEEVETNIKETKKDSKGRIVVAENVRVIIDGTIGVYS